jgi:hypothetical protein
MLGIIGPGVSLQLQDGTDVTARVEHFGWYQGYRVPYLDAGYPPTFQHLAPNGDGGTETITELLPQILYVPDTVPDGMGAVQAGTLQNFFSILQFGPTDTNWSPIAHVILFTPTDPMNLPTRFADVDAAETKTDNNLIIAIIPVPPAMH